MVGLMMLPEKAAELTAHEPYHTFVEYSFGHPMLTSIPNTSFSLK